MRLGLVTPVVSRNPRAHNQWERDAGIDAIAAVARHADRLGYSHLTCSEHVAVPSSAESTRGACYWDPLATFGYLAACTSTIRLATHVLVLGYHHPLEIAKRYGTLDRLCGGRVILGVGVGSLQEEFELLGARFDDRGVRGDDALRALRASLSRREPAYEGDYYRFAGMVIEPCAVQPRVPLWVGGRTVRSLRRAVELGDGWAPFRLTPGEIGPMLDAVRSSGALARRATPFDVVLHPPDRLDPLAEPASVADTLGSWEAVGATALNVRLRSSSLEHHLAQLTALAELAALTAGDEAE